MDFDSFILFVLLFNYLILVIFWDMQGVHLLRDQRGANIWYVHPLKVYSTKVAIERLSLPTSQVGAQRDHALMR
jgi:hypothetical protein